MSDFSITPYGLATRGEIIEDPSLDVPFRMNSDGTVSIKNLHENYWDYMTAASALLEAQDKRNFCDYTFASGWGGAGSNSTIDFFGTQVPCRVMGNTGNWMCSQSAKLIPNKNIAYLFSIWMYCTQKTAGNQYWGLYVYTPSAQDVVYSGSGTSTTNNPYFHTYAWNDSRVPKNKWVNYRGILVPTAYTSGCGEYYLRNIVRNDASMMVVECTSWYRFGENNTRMLARFLDYYNNTQQSYSWWALPSVLPVKVMGVTADRVFFKYIKEAVL